MLLRWGHSRALVKRAKARHKKRLTARRAGRAMDGWDGFGGMVDGMVNLVFHGLGGRFFLLLRWGLACASLGELV